MNGLTYARKMLAAARGLQTYLDTAPPLSSEVAAPRDQPVLPHSLLRSTRGYLERIGYQINSSYRATAYDACAVMIRRLVEVLIIECFEAKGRTEQVKDSAGNYFFLEALVGAALSQADWSLGRGSKVALGRLKAIGDQSAHSRRYNAKREYIDDVILDLRALVEELLYVSGLRR